jgi:hypothetical protein
MKTVSCISHDKKDKEYIIKLLNKAKTNKILSKNISFSELAISCVTEYLENLSTGK